MSMEQIMQAVLSATPATKRKLEAVLNGTDTQKADGAKDTRLITISGAARLLNIGRNTIYRLLESGRLDFVDLNGSRRITMRSVTAFLNGERPTNEKTEEIIATSKARYAASKAKEVR